MPALQHALRSGLLELVVWDAGCLAVWSFIGNFT
jgi:hypothetical protein